MRIAADPLPAEMDTRPSAPRGSSRTAGVLSVATLEKVCLVGLICVIYGAGPARAGGSPTGLFVGLAVFVVINAAISLAVARGGRGTDSAPSPSGCAWS